MNSPGKNKLFILLLTKIPLFCIWIKYIKAKHLMTPLKEYCRKN